MDKNNHKELDLKIKEALIDNDKIAVPEKISKGIDETLKNLDTKDNHISTSNRIKKATKIASIGLILLLIICTPPGVEAIKAVKDAIYTYIPSLGDTINTNEQIYILKEPITVSTGKRKTTLTEVYYNQSAKLIIVDVEGNGKLPEDKAVLKINNKKLKSYESSVSTIRNTGTNISWVGSYFFEYNKPYNNKDLEFKLLLENKETVEIKCSLEEAKNATNITDLGPSTSNKGITITGIIEEKGNILEVNFLENLKDQNIGVTYGDMLYSDLKENEITLTDANNNVVVGKRVEDSLGFSYNKFRFDVENLKKPYNINIEKVGTYMHKEVSSSEIIELPIPLENEELIIDKNISLEIKDKLIEGSNTDVNIVSIKREYDDECTIKLKYFSEDKKEVELVGCVVVPAGDSTSDKAKDWFEDGLSGSVEEGHIRTLTFKLPYPDADKLYIQVRGNEYNITGPWDIVVE